jgi:hypothetical protein
VLRVVGLLTIEEEKMNKYVTWFRVKKCSNERATIPLSKIMTISMRYPTWISRVMNRRRKSSLKKQPSVILIVTLCGWFATEISTIFWSRRKIGSAWICKGKEESFEWSSWDSYERREKRITIPHRQRKICQFNRASSSRKVLQQNSFLSRVGCLIWLPNLFFSTDL